MPEKVRWKRVVNHISILLATILLVGCAGDEAIHQDWVEADRQYAAEVKAVLNNDPQHADTVLFETPVTKKQLGFGYTLAEAFRGKGYLGFEGQMLYYKDKLVSFRITPALDEKLIGTYMGMLRDVFPLKASGDFQPFNYHPEGAVSPLPGCPVAPHLNAKMDVFCSPFSGIEYGTRGGYFGATLPNRRAYLAAANEMDDTMCLRLLYSINPATRLTAYEHYQRHKTAITTIEHQVEDRMQEVFKEVPTIETLHGCILTREDSHALVQSLVASGIGQNHQ